MPPASPKDLWDLPLSTESAVAGEQYVLAVEKMLSANVGAEEALGRALAADPGFALAHAAHARALQLRGAMPEARAAAARAVELAPSATRRERGHVEAIALNVESDMPRTKSGCIAKRSTSASSSATAGAAPISFAASRISRRMVASLDVLRKKPGRARTNRTARRMASGSWSG